MHNIHIDTVIDTIGNTITPYGRYAMYYSLSSNNRADTHDIIKINRKIYRDKPYRKKMRSLLKRFNEQSKVSKDWFGDRADFELYYDNSFFNTKYMLNAGNKLKFSNTFIMILIYLCIYIFFYINGRPISIADYANKLFEGYRLFSSYMLSMLFNNQKIIYYIAMSMAYAYVIYQAYNVYNGINTCIKHYRKCRGFNDRYQKMVDLLKTAEDIYAEDSYTRTPKVKKALLKLKIYFGDETNLGHNLHSRMNSGKYVKYYNHICEYVGMVDMKLTLLDKVSGDMFSKFCIPRISQSVSKHDKFINVRYPFSYFYDSVTINIKNDDIRIDYAAQNDEDVSNMHPSKIEEVYTVCKIFADRLGVCPGTSAKITPIDREDPSYINPISGVNNINFNLSY